VWVNPTYLWSGIVGGLIMGVGFIVGGFCPGTSLVAMATRKIDGLFFVLGGLFGIFLFGETERFYDLWWNFAGYMGRITIRNGWDCPTGWSCRGCPDGAVYVLGLRAAGAHFRRA